MTGRGVVVDGGDDRRGALPPLFLRYFGSHFTSLEQARGYGRMMGAFGGLGWRTAIVLSGPPSDPSWLEGLESAGTRIAYLPRPRGNFDPSCILRAYRLCRRLGASAIVCDNIHTGPLVGAALAGVASRVWTKRSMEPHFEECRKPTLQDRAALSLRVSCRAATRTLAVSQAVKDEITAMGISSRKVEVLRNPQRYAGGPAYREGLRKDARHRFGYAPSALVIVAVGHAVPVKGWDLLLGAFTAVSAELPEARLLLVGSTSAGHERATYEELLRSISQHKLADKVQFTGHLGDPAEALAAGDLFVMSSRSEGYGNVLVEALSLGLPCISTRVGVAPEIILDGVSGLLVERENQQSLARSILLLGRDPELRGRLARQGFEDLRVPTPAEHTIRVDAICRSSLPVGRIPTALRT